MPPNAYPCPVSGQASPHGQQGWFLLPVVMLLFALSLGSYFALATTNARSSEARRASTDAVALEAARAALLAWAFTPPAPSAALAAQEVSPATFPYPDRQGKGYSTCPTQGTNLNTAASEARRFGWLPERGEALPNPPSAPWAASPCDGNGEAVPRNHMLSSGLRDSLNNRLWYAVSANLLDRRVKHSTTYRQPITFASLDTTSQWLTVCDRQGQVVSDRVAMVLLAGGVPLTGVVRPANSTNAALYLDTTIFPTTADARCKTGTALQNSNADADARFVLGEADATFNDRVLLLTADQFKGMPVGDACDALPLSDACAFRQDHPTLERFITQFFAAWLRDHPTPPLVRYTDTPPEQDPYVVPPAPLCEVAAPLNRPTLKTAACYPSDPTAVDFPVWLSGDYDRNPAGLNRPAGVATQTWLATLRYEPVSTATQKGMKLQFDGWPFCYLLTRDLTAPTTTPTRIQRRAYVATSPACPAP